MRYGCISMKLSYPQQYGGKEKGVESPQKDYD